MLKINLNFVRVGLVIMSCSLTQCANELLNSDMKDSVYDNISKEEKSKDKKLDYIDSKNSKIFDIEFTSFVRLKTTLIDKKSFSYLLKEEDLNEFFDTAKSLMEGHGESKHLFDLGRETYDRLLTIFYDLYAGSQKLSSACDKLNCTSIIYLFWGLEVDNNQREWTNFIALFDDLNLKDKVKKYLTKTVLKIIQNGNYSCYFAPSFKLLYETCKHTKELGKKAAIISLGSGEGGFEMLHWFANPDAFIVLLDHDAKALGQALFECNILEKDFERRLNCQTIDIDLCKAFSCEPEVHKKYLDAMATGIKKDPSLMDIKFSIVMFHNYLSLQVKDFLKKTFDNLKSFLDTWLMPGGLFTMINDAKDNNIDDPSVYIRFSIYNEKGGLNSVEKRYFDYYDKYSSTFNELCALLKNGNKEGEHTTATVLFGLGSYKFILGKEKYTTSEEVRSQCFNYLIDPKIVDSSFNICCIETISKKH